jgi:hypothetical protein
MERSLITTLKSIVISVTVAGLTGAAAWIRHIEHKFSAIDLFQAGRNVEIRHEAVEREKLQEQINTLSERVRNLEISDIKQGLQ